MGLVVFLAVLLVGGLTALAYRHIVPTVREGHALMSGYDSLAELEEDAEIIAVIEITGKGKNVIRGEKDEPKSFFTYTEVEVKNSFTEGFSPGTRLEIVEPVGYDRQLDGLYFIGRHGYVPVKRNSTYLLFLTKLDSGAYGICGGSLGKYVWPFPQNRTPSQLEVDEFGGSYQALLQEIEDKYN